MRKWLFGFTGLLFAVAIYLFYFPTDLDPVFWRPPKAPELAGKYLKNDLLARMDVLSPGYCHQCEDVDVDTQGRIYGGDSKGRIIRLDPQSGESEVFADTKGRPLGLDFDRVGNLVVADAEKGLLRIDSSGQVESLVTESGVQDGLVLVNAMHITASVFINDNETGLHADYDRWLEELAPFDPSPERYHHNRTGEDNADAHHKRQIMGREVVVAITDGKLHLGPWEHIFYYEFDGARRKRILVKIIGE